MSSCSISISISEAPARRNRWKGKLHHFYWQALTIDALSFVSDGFKVFFAADAHDMVCRSWRGLRLQLWQGANLGHRWPGVKLNMVVVIFRNNSYIHLHLLLSIFVWVSPSCCGRTSCCESYCCYRAGRGRVCCPPWPPPLSCHSRSGPGASHSTPRSTQPPLPGTTSSDNQHWTVTTKPKLFAD